MTDYKTVIVGRFEDEMTVERVMMEFHLENGFYKKFGKGFILYDLVPMADNRQGVEKPTSKHIRE